MSRKERIFTNPVYVVLLAVFTNILWGSAWPSIKIGNAQFNVTNMAEQILFAGYRFFGAGLVLLIVYTITQKQIPVIHKENNNRRVVFCQMIFQTFLQYMFSYIGAANISGTNSSIFSATNTFIAVILAHFVYADDKLNGKKVLACSLGFVGVLCATLGSGTMGFSATGEGLIVMSSLAGSIGTIISKKSTKTDGAVTVTGYSLGVGGFALMVVGWIMGARLSFDSLGDVVILAYLMFISAVGFTLWTLLNQYNKVGRLSIFSCVVPISGTLLSGIFLKENIFQIQYLASLILITAGIYVLNREPKVRDGARG